MPLSRVDGPLPPGIPAPRGAPPVAPSSLAESGTGAYVLVQASALGLRNADDDGRVTYIALAAAPPATLKVFDAQGEPLTHHALGTMLAVPGTHAGILLRDGARNAFVTPNPLATAGDRFPLDTDPAVVALRVQMREQEAHAEAFQRALAAAERAEARVHDIRSGGATPPQSASAATAASTPSDDPLFVQRLGNGDLLLRVFFASGGRGIVRPDDGLRRVEELARGADSLQITGYTDSVGSADRNSRLAAERAHAVERFLVARGIPAERITVAAAGARLFIAENTSPEGRAMNRRVEIILSYDAPPTLPRRANASGAAR